MLHASNRRRTTTAIVIAISVSSLVALGPIIFGSQAAQAQRNPHLGVVTGQGSGQMVCPDGESFSTSLQVNAGQRSDGDWAGSFDIEISGVFADAGVITDGHVTPSRFSVEGTQTEDVLCTDNGGGSATAVTIKGKCDDSATIEFSAANGQRGTFVGFADCARFSN